MNPQDEAQRSLGLAGQVRAVLESDRPIAVVRGDGWAANPTETNAVSAYVREYGRSYRNVFWLRADRRSLFRSEFAQLAIRVGVSGGHALNLGTMTEFTREWLARERDWLLVVDGVSDSADLVLRTVENLPGHIIVAGTRFECPSSVACIDTGSPPIDGVRPLADWLGHPLVAAQLAVCRQVLGVRNPERSLLEDVPHGTPVTLQDVLRPLVGSVVASMRSVDEAAAELAAACAYLDGRNIPPDLLVTQRAHLPQPLANELAAPARASALFDRLSESALVGPGVDRLTMHPVLQRTLQSLQRPQERAAWVKRTVGLVLDSFPPELEYGGFVDGCARLLGTALCVSETCVRLETELRQAGVLLNRTGQYLHGFGDDEGARKCLEYAARISAKLDGETSPLLALRLNNLGAAELGAGAGFRALDLFVQALNIVKPVEQSNGELMCEILRNIANGCLEVGDLTAARKWLKEALARHVHHHGRNHVYVAECLNLLGVVYAKSGEDAKALKSFDRAVATGRMARSCDPAHLASYHANWGKALRDAGEMEKAESAFREALKLYQEQFGAEHDQTAAVLLQLARLRRRQKRYEEAIDGFEQAFTIMSRIGPAAALPGIAQQLGRAHSLDDNTAAAAEWLGRAVRLLDEHGEYDVEDTIRLLVDAGEAMLEAQRLEEAAAFYERAKALDEADESPVLRRSARIEEGLGQLRERAQDYPGALECYTRARSKFVRALGENDARSALQSVNVARCLHRLGRGIEAVANVVHAERILSEQLGSSHRETRRARELLEQFRD